MPDATPETRPPNLDRRSVLGVAAGALAVAALSGCSSSPEPLPPLSRRRPTYDRVRPRTEYDAPSATTPSESYVGSFVSRSQWTSAQPNMNLANRMGRVTRITVHHDGMDTYYDTTSRAAIDRLEMIRRSHTNRGWADIGYHFAVDPAGRVYEGRPAQLQGAHVSRMNEQNLGILVMGNFNNQEPTPAVQRTLVSFISSQRARFGVSTSRIYTHQELKPTQCPGRTLQAFMQQARRSGQIT